MTRKVMNPRDVFALSNNPSNTAFQPIDKDSQFEPRRRTPTTITFKSSKAISAANQVDDKERDFAEDCKRDCNVDLFEILPLNEEDQSSEQLSVQETYTSRSNSNCSDQSLFSDELSFLTFNSITKNQQPNFDCTSGKLISKRSNSSSLYNTQSLNKHLLISDRHSPQLLIGSQLPAGVCCVLTSNPMNKSTRSVDLLNGDQELFRIFNHAEDPLSPEGKQADVELLDIPKRQKRHKASRSKSQSNRKMEQRLSNRQSDSLISNQATQSDIKPQFRFTRYDTVEEDAGSHIKLLAIDHMPNQAIFQSANELANLNQTRLIQTNLLKQKFSKSNQTSQPMIVNNQSNSIGQLPNGGFKIVSPNCLIAAKCNQCSQAANSREINNNVCMECENTKKILHSNLVQLIPLGSGQIGSTTNSNASPISIQISPLSSAHSTCSGNLHSTTLSSTSIGLPIVSNNVQSISAPVSSKANNVFKYDEATIQQYAIALNDPMRQQVNDNNLINFQERAVSSMSGLSDIRSINKVLNSGYLPTARSVSSCAQFSVIPSMQDLNQQPINLPNQFQASTNQSRSEQNLVSSNRFSNPNGFLTDNNQSIDNQRQQYHSQQQIYQVHPSNNSFNNPMVNQNLNQINNQNLNQFGNPNFNQVQNSNFNQIPTNSKFNRPYRLSFRTPSPTLLTSSSLADSGLESPSATYVDNNDSVNIFNKYQLGSSSNSYFNSHFYSGPKEHDFFRKAVPTLPVILAVLLCILNWFLPGSALFTPAEKSRENNLAEMKELYAESEKNSATQMKLKL